MILQDMSFLSNVESRSVFRPTGRPSLAPLNGREERAEGDTMHIVDPQHPSQSDWG